MLMIVDINESIYSRIKKLREKYERTKDGADKNCKLCDGTGIIKTDLNKIFRSDKSDRIIEEECECVQNNKTEIEREIIRLQNVYGFYLKAFKKSDSKNIDDKKESITITDYENMFDAMELTHSISQWLIHSLPVSLFFTGVSGSGKTTMLKILWQILMINHIGVYYFDCPVFETMCRSHYTEKGLYEKINTMVSIAKNADVLLMDDHACFLTSTSIERYLDIFDYRSEANKHIVLVSNKTYSEVIESYDNKNTNETRLMAERIKSRFERLCMVSLEFRRCEYALQK